MSTHATAAGAVYPDHLRTEIDAYLGALSFTRDGVSFNAKVRS